MVLCRAGRVADTAKNGRMCYGGSATGDSGKMLLRSRLCHAISAKFCSTVALCPAAFSVPGRTNGACVWQLLRPQCSPVFLHI